MIHTLKYLFCLSVLFIAGCVEAAGQRYPERRHIRSGNRSYERLEYEAAEGEYREAIAENAASFEAGFNLADALYKQELLEEAESAFGELLQNESLTGEQQAKILHNLGNTQFAGKKLKEAAESYKRSLILNPADMETKFNLAYVQKLLEDQQGGGGNGGQDQNKDNSGQNDSNDQNNEQQGNDSGETDSQSGDRQEDDLRDNGMDDGNPQNNGQGDQPQSPRQPKPEAGEQRPTAMSREDAAQMLEALQQQEDKTRDKVEEKQGSATPRNSKNW